MVESRPSEGFADFASAELSRLWAFARLLTGSEADAWDLTQDTMVRVAERWTKVDTERSPRAYAKQIMVNLNTDRLRRLRRESIARVRLTAMREVVEATGQATGTNDEPLLDGLRQLPARQRTTIVLRYFDDLSVAEIALLMSCSEGTVKSQLSRGLGALRLIYPTTTEGD